MSYAAVSRIVGEGGTLWFVWFNDPESTQIVMPTINFRNPANEARTMTEPKPGDTFILPSNSVVKVDRKHQNESYSCSYIDALGNVLAGRALSPGVTLTLEFLMLRSRRTH